MKAAVSCAILAWVATAAIVGAQDAFICWYSGAFPVSASVDFGTGVGLVVEQPLDKPLDIGRKRAALVARFGEKGFEYAGNQRKDPAVWRANCRAILVGDAALAAGAIAVAEVERVFPRVARSLGP